MGAWIEMDDDVKRLLDAIVAPFMGAWIEIEFLKDATGNRRVAPFMGAWIEMIKDSIGCDACIGRTLYGCVD